MNTTLRLLPLLAALALAGCATAPAPQPTPEPTAPAAPVAPEAPAPVTLAPVAEAPATPANTVEVEASPIDPLRPDVRINLNDSAARTDLWARTRQGFAMPDLDSDLVRKWEQYYTAKPEYLQRMFERGGRYLFQIVDDLNRRNMPTDLALLPFIESAFNPQAMSTAKASGMWQFIPGTGRDFDLKQNIFRDDRRDVLASTRAALDYLNNLHGMFNDWHLALAAYNWGQGSVQKAINRNKASGQPTDYEHLNMPLETRNYVPKLQAIKNIVARPQAFGINLPPLQNHPYYLAVPIQRDIDVDMAVKLSGISLEEFKQLNPQMNRPVILAAGTPQVLLPYDSANRFVHALSQHKGLLASWTAWVATKSIRPSEVAKQFGMYESQLREVNRIPPRMLVKAGSTLLVLRTAQRAADVPEQIADNATLALTPDLPPMRKINLRVGKRGSSVLAVAKQYKVSPAMVAQWNGVATGAHFKQGQTVVVMVPNKRTVAARKHVRGNTRVAAAGGKRLSRPGAPARRR